MSMSSEDYRKSIELFGKPPIEVINELPVKTLLRIARCVCTDFASGNYRRTHNKANLQHSVRKAWSTGNRQEQILRIIKDDGYIKHPVIKREPEPTTRAVCEYCGKVMLDGKGCIPSVYIDRISGNKVPAYKFGEEPGCENVTDPCGDCGCEPGYYHHVSCDIEKCPVCGGQALLRSCGHIRKFENGETTWK